MKLLSVTTTNQDDRTSTSSVVASSKEATRKLRSWAKDVVDDPYIGDSLEYVNIDDKNFEGDPEDRQAVWDAVTKAKTEVIFETTGGNFLTGYIKTFDIDLWLVNCANSYLITSGKAFFSLNDAIQFVIDDFNHMAEEYKSYTNGTPAKTPSKDIIKCAKTVASPTDWPIGIKWSIQKQ